MAVDDWLQKVTMMKQIEYWNIQQQPKTGKIHTDITYIARDAKQYITHSWNMFIFYFTMLVCCFKPKPPRHLE